MKDDIDELILIKKTLNGYEKTTVNKNGQVNTEINNKGLIRQETKTIDIFEEMSEQLINLCDIFCSVYDNNKEENYEVIFNNHTFYSMNLYIDLMLMIKRNRLNYFSVIKEYEKQKQIISQKDKLKMQIDNLLYCDKLKNTIDVNDVIIDDSFISKKKIISFDLASKTEFELGETRFFSDTIDVPEDFEIPNGFDFVGQINLKDIKDFDNNNLLEKQGMLYFFQAPSVDYEEKHYFFELGKVIYTDNMNLVRKKVDMEDYMIMNLSIKNITNDIEDFNSRYSYKNGNLEYDSFYSDDLNKIYGFYTDCQMDVEDIKKISQKYIVLLQLGSTIYGEGVTTFLISKEDLINKNFDKVIYQYVQS